jgi:hippurate hydrolase
MPVLNRVAEMADEITGWRRHLHTIPELLYDVHQTSAFVATKLKEFGVERIETGIGRTGVVGLIKGNLGDGPVIGLRADMDALPIKEATGAEWASTVPGKMHACGHDGHTAMLLGAAKYLAETRNFAGHVAVIFQPAEEGGAGGKAMVDDGMMERFAINKVFGMHNMPNLPVGEFAIRPGPIMAAADQFVITIDGRGGHAAMPHQAIDPVLIGAHVVTALQSVASRGVDPLESVVISVTKFHGGDAHNVIPASVELAGTLRALTPEVRQYAETRLHEIVEATAKVFGGKASVAYHRGYPVTVNHDEETRFVVDVARQIAGDSKVNDQRAPVMGGEDFSFMLEARPGAFIFMGNGNTASLHHPEYDFDDEAIPHGVTYWVKLAETALKAA